MNLQALMQSVQQAEANVNSLKASVIEKKLARIYFIFTALCVGFFVIKALLVGIGVFATIASPLTIVLCSLLIVGIGSILLARALARKKAHDELVKNQAALLQFRNMKQTLFNNTSGGSGGWSLYKKNSAVLTKAMTAQQNKEAANAKAAENKAAAETAQKDDKTSPLKTNMRRGSM